MGAHGEWRATRLREGKIFKYLCDFIHFNEKGVGQVRLRIFIALEVSNHIGCRHPTPIIKKLCYLTISDLLRHSLGFAMLAVDVELCRTSTNTNVS